MFDKILFPTDFSEVSVKVLDVVKKLRGTGSQEVVILHVIDKKSLDFTFYDMRKALTAETALLQRAQQYMVPIVNELRKCGFSVKERIETAVVFKEIMRIEEEEDVSLIVIGSHGKSNVEEILLGSVSETVVRKARSPVLVVKR